MDTALIKFQSHWLNGKTPVRATTHKQQIMISENVKFAMSLLTFLE
jgi:hypothetical protein